MFFCCSIFLLSCLEKPSYNPFDNQTNIDRRYLLSQGMDTIIDGCGWYSLTYKKKRFSPFYQFHFDDKNLLQAKGFNYITDTIFSNSENIDSIRALDFSINDINKRLKKFKKKLVKNGDSLFIEGFKHFNSTILDKSVTWENDSTYIRSINFYRPFVK